MKSEKPLNNGKMKLSREELLAGKCIPEHIENKPSHDDQRIKSPDELLMRMLEMKSTGVQIIRNPFNDGESSTKNDITENILKESPKPGPKLEFIIQPKSIEPSVPIDEAEKLRKELEDLKKNHTKEIRKWETYDKTVREWRDQVVKTIDDVKTELAETRALKIEIQILREELHIKNQQIADLD